MDKKWLQRKQQLIPTKADVSLLDTHDPLVRLRITNKNIKAESALQTQVQPDLRINYEYNIQANDLFGDILSDMEASCNRTMNTCAMNDGYYYSVLCE